MNRRRFLQGLLASVAAAPIVKVVGDGVALASMAHPWSGIAPVDLTEEALLWEFRMVYYNYPDGITVKRIPSEDFYV